MELRYFGALLLVAAITTIFAQELTEDGCYYEYLSTRIMCLEPWETCKDIENCAECMAICTQFAGICQAVVYKQSTKECMVYRQAIKPPGYGGRKKRAAGCYGNMPPSLVKNNPDYTYYIVSNSSTCGSVVTQAPQPVSNPPVVTTAPPPPPPVTTAMPPPPPVTTDIPPPHPMTTISDTPATSQPLPSQATCPDGQSPLLVEQKGVSLGGNPDSEFQATSEQACTQACISNQQPTGVVSPCQSAEFDTSTQKCKFYLNAATPLGTGNLSPSAQINHYEKNCMDSGVVQLCPGPVLKAPQKLLVGYAETVITTTSEADCYVQCFNSQARFGFHCASGQYYFQESSNNCILNSESATTQPSVYTDESVDKLNYFEPLCMGGGATLLLDMKAKAKSPLKPKNAKKTGTVAPTKKPTHAPTKKAATPAPTTKKPKRFARDAGDLKPPRKHIIIWPNLADWGSWTRCDGVDSIRYHYKNCKSFNPNKCEVSNEPCDPTNRDKEMQDIANEEAGTGGNGNNGDNGIRNGTDTGKKESDFLKPKGKVPH